MRQRRQDSTQHEVEQRRPGSHAHHRRNVELENYCEPSKKEKKQERKKKQTKKKAKKKKKKTTAVHMEVTVLLRSVEGAKTCIDNADIPPENTSLISKLTNFGVAKGLSLLDLEALVFLHLHCVVSRNQTFESYCRVFLVNPPGL